MPKKVSYKRAAAEGAKETAAVTAVTVGIMMVQQGVYQWGVALVAIGAALFIVDKVIE